MEWKAFLFSLSVMKGNIFRFFAPGGCNRFLLSGGNPVNRLFLSP